LNTLENAIDSLVQIEVVREVQLSFMIGSVDVNSYGKMVAVVIKHEYKPKLSNIVTASIDRMTFLKPVYIGNALILSARLNYVKKSSMEVEVTVDAEDLDTGK